MELLDEIELLRTRLRTVVPGCLVKGSNTEKKWK